MHPTAKQNCKNFFDVYSSAFSEKVPKIVEIGSQDVNGSLRDVAPVGFDYVGVDFVPGKGVDIVLDDPYVLPLSSESTDIVVSSSCFEHSEMVWLSFLEIMRILKPKGLFYLNAPSNGVFHRHPVDCWRFYPDSGRALVAWARRNAMHCVLLESYISAQLGGGWNDFVAVFLKDEEHVNHFPGRVLHKKKDIYNGLVYPEKGFINYHSLPEDQRILRQIGQSLASHNMGL